MSNLRQAAQQALEALENCAMTIEWEWGECRDLEEMRELGEYTEETTAAIRALRAALAEPQTTHWEGCEAVHPECKAPTRKPLTKEQVMSIAVLRYNFALNGGAGPISKRGKEIIEAIERAHGIGEQT